MVEPLKETREREGRGQTKKSIFPLVGGGVTSATWEEKERFERMRMEDDDNRK